MFGIMKIMIKEKGFTLIELLMVLTIISLLAAIILTSISTSRVKGIDGAIKKQVVEIRSQSELHWNTNTNSYLNLCVSGTNNVSSMLTKLATISGTSLAVNSGVAQTATTLNCNTSVAQYAISVKLKQGSSYLCIDSSNKTLTTAIPLAANSTVCQ